MINTETQIDKSFKTTPLKKFKEKKDWETISTESEQLARWMALYDAVNLIADKAEERSIRFDSIDIPPIKVKDYMDSTVDIYHRKILEQIYGIRINYKE